MLQSDAVTIPEALALALQHHQSERLAEAESIYRQILAVEPRHADALHLLGVLADQVGRQDVAMEMIRQAIVLLPTAPAFHSNLGEVYRKMGRLEEAIASYQKAIHLKPDDALAHSNLGVALRDQGRLAEAMAACRRALEIKPDYAEAHYNLGNVFRDQGRLADAVAAYRRALQLKPGYVEACNNLGVVLRDQGQLDEALRMYRQAIELQPDLPEASNNLGNALSDQGQPHEAAAAYRRAIRLRPGYAEAYSNLGAALMDQGHFEEAIAAERRAIELRPEFPEAHNSLGNALNALVRLDEALVAYRRAIELKPDYAEAYYNMGIALRDLGRIDEVVATCHRAIEIQPDYAMACNNLATAYKDRGELDSALAAFRRAVEIQPGDAGLLSNVIYTLHFHPGQDHRRIAAEHARWNRRFAEPLRHAILPHGNDRDPERRLRIGYVSPDLKSHPVGRFVVPLLEAHDRAGHAICVYASVRCPDLITERLRKSAEVWRDVGAKNDESLAEMIRADGIDILVDLTQHMAHNRLPLFARKPAPVQVAWLGYPGSTGLEAMDYRFTDAWMEPDGSEGADRVEKAVRLPDSWFCFDPIDEYPAVGELPSLRTGQVTFGSLNNFCKVNSAVLHRWAELLRAVPGSKLLMGCPTGETEVRVRQLFASRGIGAERLELAAGRSFLEYLRLYQRIDIGLDPFPYSGGTTTCDSLWMGVPVVTLPGKLAVSRIAFSILSTLGLRGLIAHSEEEYLKIAVELAGDLPRLAELRATLRDRMKGSALMDAPRFARNVESAYRQMWRAWCAQQCSKSSP